MVTNMRAIKDIFLSYGVLDGQGRHVNGTDKQTNHNYGPAYERLLTQIRRLDARYVMEVGVAGGSSLLAWSEVFPNAVCVGLDIMPDPIHLLHDKERIEFYVGNMRNQADCERAANGRMFDFICEDATHQLADTLLAFLYLWPFVKPGGLYVVEEWSNAASLMHNIREMWPFAEIIGTTGTHIEDEPIIFFRKPYP